MTNGVYRFRGGHESWHQKVMASTLQLSPHGMASHRTAAFLWGMQGLGGATALLEVIAPFGLRRHVLLAKVHHSRVISTPVLREGIPTTPLARTVVDLSDVLDRHKLGIAFDSAWRTCLTLPQDLQKELSLSGRKRRRRTWLQQLIDRAKGDRHTDSPLEARMGLALDASRLPRPVRQYFVSDPFGNFIARVDFAWPALRVVVQGDSRG